MGRTSTGRRWQRGRQALLDVGQPRWDAVAAYEIVGLFPWPSQRDESGSKDARSELQTRWLEKRGDAAAHRGRATDYKSVYDGVLLSIPNIISAIVTFVLHMRFRLHQCL